MMALVSGKVKTAKREILDAIPHRSGGSSTAPTLQEFVPIRTRVFLAQLVPRSPPPLHSVVHRMCSQDILRVDELTLMPVITHIFRDVDASISGNACFSLITQDLTNVWSTSTLNDGPLPSSYHLSTITKASTVSSQSGLMPTK